MVRTVGSSPYKGFQVPYSPVPKTRDLKRPPEERMEASLLEVGTPSKPSRRVRIPIKMPPSRLRPEQLPKQKKTPSCCGQISHCISGCFSSFCTRLKRIFCCCQKEKVDYVALAKREAENFRGQTQEAHRFAILKKMAELCRGHPETKAQYDEVVSGLNDECFRQWLDINGSRTFEQVKKDASAMVRAAGYARACAEREALVNAGTTPQILRRILDIKIGDPDDAREFKQRSYNMHRMMLPEDERHLTLKEFLQKY